MPRFTHSQAHAALSTILSALPSLPTASTYSNRNIWTAAAIVSAAQLQCYRPSLILCNPESHDMFLLSVSSFPKTYLNTVRSPANTLSLYASALKSAYTLFSITLELPRYISTMSADDL